MHLIIRYNVCMKCQVLNIVFLSFCTFVFSVIGGRECARRVGTQPLYTAHALGAGEVCRCTLLRLHSTIDSTPPPLINLLLCLVLYCIGECHGPRRCAAAGRSARTQGPARPAQPLSGERGVAGSARQALYIVPVTITISICLQPFLLCVLPCANVLMC
jgi:hypothetical protein